LENQKLFAISKNLEITNNSEDNTGEGNIDRFLKINASGNQYLHLTAIQLFVLKLFHP